MEITAVLFCVFGVAICFPWGIPQQVHDTPEVAAAKASHLAAHAKARYTGHSWGAQDRSWEGAGVEDDGSWKQDGNDGAWKDDGSWKHYDDGSWKDDTHSWNEHSSSPHWESHEKKWTGPVALPPGYDKHGAPLPVHDTPEVAAAKSKHFELYHHAAAHAAHSHVAPVWQAHNAAQWHSGPADTPDVAAAKAAHFAAHAERKY